FVPGRSVLGRRCFVGLGLFRLRVFLLGRFCRLGLLFLRGGWLLGGFFGRRLLRGGWLLFRGYAVGLVLAGCGWAHRMGGEELLEGVGIAGLVIGQNVTAVIVPLGRVQAGEVLDEHRGGVVGDAVLVLEVLAVALLGDVLRADGALQGATASGIFDVQRVRASSRETSTSPSTTKRSPPDPPSNAPGTPASPARRRTSGASAGVTQTTTRDGVSENSWAWPSTPVARKPTPPANAISASATPSPPSDTS